MSRKYLAGTGLQSLWHVKEHQGGPGRPGNGFPEPGPLYPDKPLTLLTASIREGQEDS